MSHRATAILFAATATAVAALALACLLIGSVDIPPEAIFDILTGNGSTQKEAWRVIILESRLPMIITATLAGAALAIAGLLMQTTFNNPLAGPSILGVSTGASLGVAVAMLAAGGAVAGIMGTRPAAIAGATIGAAVIMAILLVFSRLLRSSTMLLITGIMVGYFASSGISLLNFFATREGVHTFVIWGMGNFTSVTNADMPLYATLITAAIAISILMIKPLNALLLGERYAVNLGVNIRLTRNLLLIISGVLTAVVTAYCGPIGFIGVIVPHIARLTFRSAHHAVLLPATALNGALIALLCTLISVIPTSSGIIPVNAITPIVGAPVIIYIIVCRNKLFYFN